MGNVLVKEETLAQIADAIREKIGSNDSYRPREMPEAILEISTYSGEGADPNKPVRFYSPYGELVYSYTVQEMAEMTELPPLPEYKGLIGQEWNWSLEKIQTVNGEVEIGPHYITDDGSTRIYVELIEGALNPKIGFIQATANSVFVDWGDGSALESCENYGAENPVSIEHKYGSAGKYTIRLIPEDGAVLTLLGDSYGTRLLHRVMDYSYENQVYGNAIQKIEIGANISKFANRCFYSGTLKSVTVPKDITEIGSSFQGCRNIECIVFPRSVKSVSSYAIRDCFSLKKLLFSESDFLLGGSSLANNYSLKEIVMASSIELVYSDIFAECRSLKRVVLPKTLKRIGSDAFQNCSALSEVVLPDGLTSIASGAFSHCGALEFIEIPEKVTRIESTVFYYCYSLRKLKLPDKITTIEANLFTNCYSLNEITIPKGVTAIEAYAFNTCKGMEHYYMLPEIPPTLNAVNVFSGMSSTCKIHVPKGCLEAYQTADVWSEFADRMVEMEE